MEKDPVCSQLRSIKDRLNKFREILPSYDVTRTSILAGERTELGSSRMAETKGSIIERVPAISNDIQKNTKPETRKANSKRPIQADKKSQKRSKYNKLEESNSDDEFEIPKKKWRAPSPARSYLFDSTESSSESTPWQANLVPIYGKNLNNFESDEFSSSESAPPVKKRGGSRRSEKKHRHTSKEQQKPAKKHSTGGRKHHHTKHSRHHHRKPTKSSTTTEPSDSLFDSDLDSDEEEEEEDIDTSELLGSDLESISDISEEDVEEKEVIEKPKHRNHHKKQSPIKVPPKPNLHYDYSQRPSYVPAYAPNRYYSQRPSFVPSQNQSRINQVSQKQFYLSPSSRRANAVRSPLSTSISNGSPQGKWPQPEYPRGSLMRQQILRERSFNQSNGASMQMQMQRQSAIRSPTKPVPSVLSRQSQPKAQQPMNASIHEESEDLFASSDLAPVPRSPAKESSDFDVASAPGRPESDVESANGAESEDDITARLRSIASQLEEQANASRARAPASPLRQSRIAPPQRAAEEEYSGEYTESYQYSEEPQPKPKPKAKAKAKPKTRRAKARQPVEDVEEVESEGSLVDEEEQLQRQKPKTNPKAKPKAKPARKAEKQEVAPEEEQRPQQPKKKRARKAKKAVPPPQQKQQPGVEEPEPQRQDEGQVVHSRPSPKKLARSALEQQQEEGQMEVEPEHEEDELLGEIESVSAPASPTVRRSPKKKKRTRVEESDSDVLPVFVPPIPDKFEPIEIPQPQEGFTDSDDFEEDIDEALKKLHLNSDEDNDVDAATGIPLSDEGNALTRSSISTFNLIGGVDSFKVDDSDEDAEPKPAMEDIKEEDEENVNAAPRSDDDESENEFQAALQAKLANALDYSDEEEDECSVASIAAERAAPADGSDFELNEEESVDSEVVLDDDEEPPKAEDIIAEDDEDTDDLNIKEFMNRIREASAGEEEDAAEGDGEANSDLGVEEISKLDDDDVESEKPVDEAEAEAKDEDEDIIPEGESEPDKIEEEPVAAESEPEISEPVAEEEPEITEEKAEAEPEITEEKTEEADVDDGENENDVAEKKEEKEDDDDDDYDPVNVSNIDEKEADPNDVNDIDDPREDDAVAVADNEDDLAEDGDETAAEVPKILGPAVEDEDDGEPDDPNEDLGIDEEEDGDLNTGDQIDFKLDQISDAADPLENAEVRDALNHLESDN